MGSVSLKIGDGTVRFCHAIILHEIETPSLPRARLSSPLLSLAPMGFVSLKIGDGTARFHRAIILREIEASERRLHQIERDLAGYKTLDPAKPVLPPKLKLVLARHPLSLGCDSRSGITTMVSSVAHSCARPAAVVLLSTFMSYHHAASCPTVDPLLLSKLISKACKPLPCRRPPPPPASSFPDLSGRLEPQRQEPPSMVWAMPMSRAGPAQPRPKPCRAGLGPRARLFEPSMVRSTTRYYSRPGRTGPWAA